MVELVATIVVGGTVVDVVVVVWSRSNWMSSPPICSNSLDWGSPHAASVIGPTSSAIAPIDVMARERCCIRPPR
ncbi:unannotated protein [freshwater metagenome]|uniref:Unannotated protein n=1 Tax=freshwater metagenome TaxID=449393 RepID=A0A6J6GJ27_9ZZZZ